MAETLLTAKEVSQQLRVSIAWVLEHAGGRRLPLLPSVKMGRAVRFRSADIQKFIEHCQRCMANGSPIQ